MNERSQFLQTFSRCTASTRLSSWRTTLNASFEKRMMHFSHNALEFMQERISCKWRLCRKIFMPSPRAYSVALSSFSHSLRSLCFRSISRPLASGTRDWAYLRLTDARSLASFVFRPALHTQLLVCFATTSVQFTRLPLGRHCCWLLRPLPTSPRLSFTLTTRQPTSAHHCRLLSTPKVLSRIQQHNTIASSTPSHA